MASVCLLGNASGVARVELCRRAHWRPLLLESVEHVSRVCEEALIHRIRKVARPVVKSAVSCRVLHVLSRPKAGRARRILLRINLGINHVLHILEVHVLHQLLLLLVEGASRVRLWRQAIESGQLVRAAARRQPWYSGNVPIFPLLAVLEAVRVL